MNRRDFLRWTAAAGVAGVAPFAASRALLDAMAAPRQPCASLKDIEHVVILIQENRSFDHYFGTYRGVRGFSDPKAIRNADGTPVFYQPDPANVNDPPVGHLLPFHLQVQGQTSYCTSDITHDWGPQHRSWNGGSMDSFAKVHLAEDPKNGQLTMGYYTRQDAPFYHALADAFTICDGYHCSVIGPTDPNRLYTMSASIDPAGKNGGPLIETLTANRQQYFGKFTWTTMPEQLQARGIDWKVYSPPDSNLENNVLAYFKRFMTPGSPLYQKAFVPTFPGAFQTDCAAGTLPPVSWVLAPLVSSEHPPAPPGLGEDTARIVLESLVANPSLWSKTVVFMTYDENGGFFDHVPPAVAPAGTAGEYLTATPINNTPTEGYLGPIGLGFRVPMLVVSPFTRGGLVASGTFDHTSTLRFLETRFGVEVPNLTAWRRSAVGDLTSALDLGAPPDTTVPALPPTTTDAQFAAQCTTSLAGTLPPSYPVPNPQSMPVQEPGSPARPKPC